MKKRKIMIILTVAVILLAAVVFFLVKYFINNDKNEYKNQTEIYREAKPDYSDTDYLEKCRKINPQAVAWLNIPDTEIDFPVVQCDNNDYYLIHDFERKESYMGVPFLDYRNSGSFSDFNSVIYGHNISNRYMFYPLLNFKNTDYFNSHEFGYLTTAEKKYKVNFLACAVIENDGFAYNTLFLSDKEKKVFLKTIKEKAVQLRDFSNEELINAQLCTLSTCSYEFTDARTVLIGVLYEIK